MRIETLAVHSGRGVDPATGAVTPPIHMSTTFERDTDGTYPQGFVYGRSGNPTRTLLEECVRDMEGGQAAAAFSSGAAALSAVFQSLATGDHVIVPQDLYHGTALLLRDRLARWGLQTSFVDLTNIDAVREAVTPATTLILVETPSNPLLKITDIARVAQLARENGIACACDNTWATPALQSCLELGADLVAHSTTKYLGGHGDVTGGMVVSAADSPMFQEIRAIQRDGGAVPSPFDCWLILRGIRTLPYRMRAHSENAARVAAFLDDHSEVLEVFYPGLPTHGGHEIAKRQMSMFGGMLSFRVRGGKEAAFRVAARTMLFTRATSLGSYESLIEHRASIEGHGGHGSTTPDDLLRVSVGLENADDLIADLDGALGR